MREISRLSRLFLPVTIYFKQIPATLSYFWKIFFLIFCPIKCENISFLHFPSPSFILILGIFRGYRNIFSQDFFPLGAFLVEFSALVAVRDFKFPRHLDFGIFTYFNFRDFKKKNCKRVLATFATSSFCDILFLESTTC